MKRPITTAAITILLALTFAGSAVAVPRPDLIRWTASPTEFIDSLYRGVLGRAPETRQVVDGWAATLDKTMASRLRAFWQFVASPEYKSKPWSKDPKRWWAIYRIVNKKPSGYCHCYYVTRDVTASLRIVGPSKRQTRGVARALTNYYALRDRDACRERSCGWRTGALGGLPERVTAIVPAGR